MDERTLVLLLLPSSSLLLLSSSLMDGWMDGWIDRWMHGCMDALPACSNGELKALPQAVYILLLHYHYKFAN
jgi:hypothetical protein